MFQLHTADCEPEGLQPAQSLTPPLCSRNQSRGEASRTQEWTSADRNRPRSPSAPTCSSQAASCRTEPTDPTLSPARSPSREQTGREWEAAAVSRAYLLLWIHCGAKSYWTASSAKTETVTNERRYAKILRFIPIFYRAPTAGLKGQRSYYKTGANREAFLRHWSDFKEAARRQTATA